MTELHWIILAVDAVLTLLATLNCLALGRIARMDSTKRSQSIQYPPVTVVVTTHNQVRELEKNLPALLSQDYPSAYEVVVVDQASDDDTIKVLEQMEELYPMLRHTFTPVTARDISLERLALTLGIRSASYQWTILLQAGCCPISPHWLKQMGECMAKGPQTSIVIGPVCPVTANKTRAYTFLWEELQWLSFAARHGAYRTGQCNVAYKQEFFMQHQGFASHAQLASGSIDIMVNRHSVPENTVACVRPESMLFHTPTAQECDLNLLYMETRRHLSRHHLYRIQYAFVAMALPTALLAGICTAVWMAFHALWWMMGCALLMLVLHCMMYHRSYARSVRRLGLNPPPFCSHLRSLFIPFSDVCDWVRHRTTDYNVFRKKFV